MITYNIRIMPNARKCLVEVQDGMLKVRVTAPAFDGRANEALLDVLSEYLKVRRSSLVLLKGEKSRNKVVGIKE